MGQFTIYPAIDLRRGKVVRLAQGDPERETIYGDDPGWMAKQWQEAGAAWLHVVNLDGAFGVAGLENQMAIQAIITAAGKALIQLGGGLRTLDDIEKALALGVSRVVVGTMALESPALLGQAVKRYGASRIATGIDAKNNLVRIRGWAEESDQEPIFLAKKVTDLGVETIIFTNIARDGVGGGVDIDSCRQLLAVTGISVIASGGVATLGDVRAVKEAGLDGVIVGRALYNGTIDLEEALTC